MIVGLVAVGICWLDSVEYGSETLRVYSFREVSRYEPSTYRYKESYFLYR
jgi:hypothetical protein